MTALPERAPRDVRPEEALEQALQELAEAHAELGRRQSFTDALLETVEVGIVSCDAQGRFVLSNRAERAMFGLDENGLDGLLPEHLPALIDVLTPDGKPIAADDYPLMRTLRGETVASYEVRVGPAGQPDREVVVRGSQILGPDGTVLGAVAALSDVTAERTASRALAEERRKLTEAQRLGRLGSFEHDFAGRTWAFSDSLCELWGLPPETMSPELATALVLDADRELLVNSWRDAVRIGASDCDYRIRRADTGAERTIRQRVEVTLGDDGAPLHGHGTHLDITDLAAAERAAREANAFFHAVLTATPDYTQVTDLATGAIIYGSPGKQVLGRPTAELQALGPGAFESLIHAEDRQSLRDLYSAAAALADGQSLQLRYRAQHADQGQRWLNHSITPFRRDDSDAVVEVVAVLRDVTDLVEAEQRLRYAARHDVLTGLPNRTMLIETLDAALRRSGRERSEVAVLFCDLDGFKHVNDTGGHAAGDAVLCETAARIRSVLRGLDTVARVGGDEFVIVVEPWNRPDNDHPGRPGGAETHRDLALQVAQRVADVLRPPINVKGTEHSVTASVGITYASPGHRPDLTAEDVLHEADAAMYVAKDAGKNRIELFVDQRQSRSA